MEAARLGLQSGQVPSPRATELRAGGREEKEQRGRKRGTWSSDEDSGKLRSCLLIGQMRRLRTRDGQEPTQGHTASQEQSQDQTQVPPQSLLHLVAHLASLKAHSEALGPEQVCMPGKAYLGPHAPR